MTNKYDSRVLRQLAYEALQNVFGDRELLERDREDLATSLVRQWITYDENATLFVGDRQIYLVLRRTPLGRLHVTSSPAGPGWPKFLIRDWKISPDNLPDIFGQLNLGQSAEVINGEGVALGLWVDPKEKSRGIEPLVKAAPQPPVKRDYLKLAADMVEAQFGNSLDLKEFEALTRSVAMQWQRHEGHGCIFLDEHWQLAFQLSEKGDGTCKVDVRRKSLDLAAVLSTSGFPPEELGELIAKFNLGQEIEFRDRNGVRRRLWHDPKAMRIRIRAIDFAPPPDRMPPIFCPKCSATLKPWREGQREQTCSQCRHTVSLG